jgi:hypothetical protein
VESAAFDIVLVLVHTLEKNTTIFFSLKEKEKKINKVGQKFLHDFLVLFVFSLFMNKNFEQ